MRWHRTELGGTPHPVPARAGRKVSQLEGSGGPAGEQLLTGYEYDDAGRLWRTVEHRHAYTDTANPLVLHAADTVTETRYTLGGRTAQQVGPPVDVTSFNWSSPDSAKSVTTYGYDDAGRQVTVTAPDGGVSHTAYDENGRVASQTSPGRLETSFGYDSSGRTVEVITPSGLTGPGDPETVSATTRFDGQVTCVTDPHIPDPDPEVTDASERCTERTNGGRVAAVTDASERCTERTTVAGWRRSPTPLSVAPSARTAAGWRRSPTPTATPSPMGTTRAATHLAYCARRQRCRGVGVVGVQLGGPGDRAHRSAATSGREPQDDDIDLRP